MATSITTTARMLAGNPSPVIGESTPTTGADLLLVSILRLSERGVMEILLWISMAAVVIFTVAECVDSFRRGYRDW